MHGQRDQGVSNQLHLVVRLSDQAQVDSLSGKGLLELELQRDDQTKRCSSLTVIREHGSWKQI